MMKNLFCFDTLFRGEVLFNRNLQKNDSFPFRKNFNALLPPYSTRTDSINPLFETFAEKFAIICTGGHFSRLLPVLGIVVSALPNDDDGRFYSLSYSSLHTYSDFCILFRQFYRRFSNRFLSSSGRYRRGLNESVRFVARAIDTKTCFFLLVFYPRVIRTA